MPGIIPPYPRIDKSNPLAAGLVMALVPGDGESIIDIVPGKDARRGKILGSSIAPHVHNGTFGRASQNWTVPASATSDIQFTSGPFSIAILAFINHQLTVSESTVALTTVAYVNESNNQGWQFSLRNLDGWAFAVCRNGSTNTGQENLTQTSNANPVVIGDHGIMGTSDGVAKRYLYVDGLLVNSATNFLNPLATTGIIQNLSSANNRIWNYASFAWNRLITPAEAAYFWQGGAVELLSARRNKIGWVPSGTAVDLSFDWFTLQPIAAWKNPAALPSGQSVGSLSPVEPFQWSSVYPGPTAHVRAPSSDQSAGSSILVTPFLWEPVYSSPASSTRTPLAGQSVGAPFPVPAAVDLWGSTYPGPTAPVRDSIPGQSVDSLFSVAASTSATFDWFALQPVSAPVRKGPDISSSSVFWAAQDVAPVAAAFDWFALQPVLPSAKVRSGAQATSFAWAALDVVPPGSIPPPPPETAAYRDRQVLRLLRDVLDTTGEFHELTTWGMPEQRGSSSESYKLAVFELAGWSEENFADDYAGTDVIHMVEYTLTLCVRDADPDARDDELDRLVCVAHNALSGASIGGLTYADWTYLKRGRYGPSLGPERHMVVTGQFAYNAEDWSVHNALPLT